VLHIFPILRAWKPYKSLNTIAFEDFRSKETVAELSQANAGRTRRDFQRAESNKAALDRLPTHELLTMCKNAAALFMEEDLPINGETQSPQDYVQTLSSTTGMPEVLGRQYGKSSIGS
jgi:hypothetical protein